jgi:serine/threonine protein kinase
MSEVDEQRERARAAREALLGRTIAGKWVLRSLIGHGGMGAVYEAENTAVGNRVAIKFVDPEFATDETVVARFSREARATSAVESAHIVSVFDAGTEDGRPYLVMELLRGEDLGERLRKSRTVPLSEALHVVAQVLKGLARAHAAGIVHRDLKPDNVFLANSDHDPLFAKIVDFGVSKIERPRASTMPMALTGRGTVLGTPLYMSPEQAQSSSDVDARADLYSVGAILFECLTGRPPHVGETYEQVILSICMSDAPDVRTIAPEIPEDVAAFVAKALSRDRDKRFLTADAMLDALRAATSGERKKPPIEPARTLVSAGVAEALARDAGDAASSATLAGLGVTFGVIAALDRAHDDEPLPMPTTVTYASRPTAAEPQASSTSTALGVASAGEIPSASASASAAPPEPSATPTKGPKAGAEPPKTPASAPPAKPTAAPRPTPKPGPSAKPLDIQRDLPP